jgi:uncharacterized protein (TIGR03000 family)
VSHCDGCDGAVIESGGTVIEGAPVEGSMQSEPMPGQTPPPPPAETATPDEARRASDKGVLTVQVPANAKVIVNGLETTSRGSHRRYVSHGLKSGQSYRYEVRAIVQQDGEPVELTKTAVLRAGQIAALNFDFADEAKSLTSLTLNVPEDAKVFLSGTPTQATGAVRRFSTSRLAQGENWGDYLVRVEVERSGQTLTKEKRITLSGGDQTELSFDFDQTELADAR